MVNLVFIAFLKEFLCLLHNVWKLWIENILFPIVTDYSNSQVKDCRKVLQFARHQRELSTFVNASASFAPRARGCSQSTVGGRKRGLEARCSRDSPCSTHFVSDYRVIRITVNMRLKMSACWNVNGRFILLAPEYTRVPKQSLCITLSVKIVVNI